MKLDNVEMTRLQSGGMANCSRSADVDRRAGRRSDDGAYRDDACCIGMNRKRPLPRAENRQRRTRLFDRPLMSCGARLAILAGAGFAGQAWQICFPPTVVSAWLQPKSSSSVPSCGGNKDEQKNSDARSFDFKLTSLNRSDGGLAN
jgi:hypothetical protein